MEPNKSPNHALEGSSSESSITSGSSHSISSSLSFSVGTYVMASWRNNFEYLAEILAVRQRARSMLGGSGDRCEYKLRFVWDHIIEWTPASRLRAASRFEIDYVLKFCREHGGEGAGKTPPPAPPVQTKSASESPLTTSFRRTVASTSIKSSKSPQEPLKKQGNHPVKSNGTSKKLKLNSSAKGANSSPQIIENHPDHGITSVTSISSTRKPRSGRNLLGSPVLTTSASSTDPATCRSNANNISSITSSNNVPTSGATTHLISAPLPFSLEGSVELDDMVYDRSVAQFHEACRKRRQLKRQAIEQERQQSEQSSRKCDVKGVFTDTTTPLSGSFSEESMCDVSKEPPLMPVSRLLRHFEETESDASSPILVASVGNSSVHVSTASLEPQSQFSISPQHISESQHPSLLPSVSPTRFSLTCSSPQPLPSNVDTATPRRSSTDSQLASQSSFITNSPALMNTSVSPSHHLPHSRPAMPDLAKSTGLISDEQQKRSQPSDRPTCDALTPLTYPCPHCPRKLRHLKLLNAHILNYHKTVASGSSHGSDSFIDIVTTQTTTTSTTASSPALQPMVITMSITSDRMSATPVSAATPLLRNLSPMPGASCEAKRLSRHTPSSINLRPSGGSESEISMSDIKVKSPLRDQTREGSRTTSAPEAQGKLVRRISGPAIQCPLLVPLSPSQLTYTPFRLLSCHRCGLRFCLPAQPNSSSTNLNTDLSLQPITPVTRANPSSLDPLIQCSICLTWSHRSCYSGEVDKTAFRLDWACDGCAGCYSDGPRPRYSRFNTWHHEWLLNDRSAFPWEPQYPTSQTGFSTYNHPSSFDNPCFSSSSPSSSSGISASSRLSSYSPHSPLSTSPSMHLCDQDQPKDKNYIFSSGRQRFSRINFPNTRADLDTKKEPYLTKSSPSYQSPNSANDQSPCEIRPRDHSSPSQLRLWRRHRRRHNRKQPSSLAHDRHEVLTELKRLMNTAEAVSRMILAGRHRLRRVAPLTRPPAQSAASPEDEEEEEDETRTEVTPSLRMRISDSTQSRLMLEPSLLDPRQLPNPVVSGELVKEFMLPQQQKKKQQYLQHSLPAQMPLISVADGSEVSPSTSTPSPPSLPQQQSASMLGLRTATTPTNASYEQINLLLESFIDLDQLVQDPQTLVSTGSTSPQLSSAWFSDSLSLNLPPAAGAEPNTVSGAACDLLLPDNGITAPVVHSIDPTTSIAHSVEDNVNVDSGPKFSSISQMNVLNEPLIPAAGDSSILAISTGKTMVSSSSAAPVNGVDLVSFLNDYDLGHQLIISELTGLCEEEEVLQPSSSVPIPPATLTNASLNTNAVAPDPDVVDGLLQQPSTTSCLPISYALSSESAIVAVNAPTSIYNGLLDHSCLPNHPPTSPSMQNPSVSASDSLDSQLIRSSVNTSPGIAELRMPVCLSGLPGAEEVRYRSREEVLAAILSPTPVKGIRPTYPLTILDVAHLSRTLVSASEPSPQTFPPANLSAAVFGTGNVVTATQLPTSAFSISSSSNPLISESLHSIEDFDLTSRVARPTFATESSVALSIAPTSIFNMVDDVDAITPITIAVTGSIHPISAPNSHTTLTTSVSSSTVLVPGAHSKLPELTNGLHSSSVNPDIHAKSTDTFSSSSSSISPSRTQQQLKQQQNPPISSTGFCCVDDDLSTLTLDVLGSGPGLLASVCDPSSNMGLVDASIPISESSCFTPSSNILPTTRSIEGAPSDAIKSIASPPFIDSNFVAIEGGENVPLSQLQFGHSTGAVHSLPSCQVSTDLSTASFKPIINACRDLSFGSLATTPVSDVLVASNATSTASASCKLVSNIADNDDICAGTRLLSSRPRQLSLQSTEQAGMPCYHKTQLSACRDSECLRPTQITTPFGSSRGIKLGGNVTHRGSRRHSTRLLDADAQLNTIAYDLLDPIETALSAMEASLTRLEASFMELGEDQLPSECEEEELQDVIANESERFKGKGLGALGRSNRPHDITRRELLSRPSNTEHAIPETGILACDDLEQLYKQRQQTEEEEASDDFELTESGIAFSASTTDVRLSDRVAISSLTSDDIDFNCSRNEQSEAGLRNGIPFIPTRGAHFSASALATKQRRRTGSYSSQSSVSSIASTCFSASSSSTSVVLDNTPTGIVTSFPATQVAGCSHLAPAVNTKVDLCCNEIHFAPDHGSEFTRLMSPVNTPSSPLQQRANLPQTGLWKRRRKSRPMVTHLDPSLLDHGTDSDSDSSLLASSAVTGGLKSEENLPHPRRLIKRQHPLRPTQRARDPYSRNRHRTSRPNDRIGFDRTAPKQSSSPFFSAASGSDINRLIKQPHLDSQPLLPGMLFSTNRLKRSSHSGTKEMASGMIKRAKILGTVRLKPDDENNKIDKMVTADKNGAIDEWVVNDMSAGRVGGKSAFSIIPVSQVPHVHQSSDPHRIHRNIASSSSSSSISLVALRRLYGLMLFTRSQRCQMLTQAASLALSQIIPQSPSLQELTHPSSSQ